MADGDVGDDGAAVTSIRITASSGRVRVISEARPDVEASRGAAVTVAGGCATVEVGSDSVEVRVPEHVDVVIGTTSGQVDVKGPVAA